MLVYVHLVDQWGRFRGCIPLLRGCVPLLRGSIPLLIRSVPLLRLRLMLMLVWWWIHDSFRVASVVQNIRNET